MLLLVVAKLLSCSEQKNQAKFELVGTTNGITNGTRLILKNSLNDSIIDTIVVHDNKFHATGALSKSPIKVILHTEDYTNYRYFWMENRKIIFDASASDFKHANISGSETEKLAQTLEQQRDTIESYEERQEIEKSFVKAYPASIVSAYILSVYTTTWGKEETSEMFNRFSKEIKASAYGRKIAKYLRLNKDPQIGDSFVDFEMRDTNGQLRRLSDLKGKTVLLEFWASGCMPCREENPNLVKTYERFHPQGFEIFAVSIDKDKDRWLKAIEEDSLPWHHVCDFQGSHNTASLIYGINGIPDNFLINEEGIIVARNLRGDLNQKLSEVMGKEG